MIGKRIVLAATLMLLLVRLYGQGYSITVEAPGYTEKEIYLGFFLMKDQYVKDTANLENGKFVFKGDEPLQPGFYLVVFPPDNMYMQLLIPDEEQENIHLFADTSDLTKPKRVIGSYDTELFYDYAAFISERRPVAEKLRKQLQEASDERIKSDITKSLESLNEEVQVAQANLIEDYPESLTALLVNANREIPLPEFDGENTNDKAYEYYKAHYFDYIDLADSRIARTPFIDEKVSYYLEKLTYQQPDSLITSLDYILNQLDKKGEAFQVFLVGFLNEYAASKIVGMDAVYVHLVDTYYATGQADWTSEEQLQKIINNANTLRPILIGKKAPDLKLQDRDKNPVVLHEVDAPYTVLYFWDPECGHCKKSIPVLIDFYNEYKEKGVEVLAVCTKLGEGEESCWDAIDEREMNIWVNASDPFLRSRFKQLYDVTSTPQIYVLDEKKNIIMKKIGSDQLSQVMDHFLSQKAD